MRKRMQITLFVVFVFAVLCGCSDASTRQGKSKDVTDAMNSITSNIEKLAEPNISIHWLDMDTSSINVVNEDYLMPVRYLKDLNWLVLKGNDILDASTGQWIKEFERIDCFSDELARVYQHVDGEGKYGFINKFGEVVIPFEWEYAYSFSEGLAVVAGKNANGAWKMGVIDKTGALTIPLEWDALMSFSDGLAAALDDSRFSYIDKTGARVISLDGVDSIYSFSEGLARVMKEDEFSGGTLMGFIDKTGAVVIPFQWQYARDFSEGLALVRTS